MRANTLHLRLPQMLPPLRNPHPRQRNPQLPRQLPPRPHRLPPRQRKRLPSLPQTLPQHRPHPSRVRAHRRRLQTTLPFSQTRGRPPRRRLAPRVLPRLRSPELHVPPRPVRKDRARATTPMHPARECRVPAAPAALAPDLVRAVDVPAQIPPVRPSVPHAREAARDVVLMLPVPAVAVAAREAREAHLVPEVRVRILA